MEPQRLIRRAMRADDHRGWHAGRLKDTAPLRDQLAIAGEHDDLGRLRGHVRRDLPATVVLKRPGDELTRNGHSRYLPASGGGPYRRVSAAPEKPAASPGSYCGSPAPVPARSMASISIRTAPGISTSASRRSASSCSPSGLAFAAVSAAS